MTRSRIHALHREATHLIRDGLCADHIDREIAALEAASPALNGAIAADELGWAADRLADADRGPR